MWQRRCAGRSLSAISTSWQARLISCGLSRLTSFLLVTHNLDLARRCDRIIEVVDGRIQP